PGDFACLVIEGADHVQESVLVLSPPAVGEEGRIDLGRVNRDWMVLLRVGAKSARIFVEPVGGPSVHVPKSAKAVGRCQGAVCKRERRLNAIGRLGEGVAYQIRELLVCEVKKRRGYRGHASREQLENTLRGERLSVESHIAHRPENAIEQGFGRTDIQRIVTDR